MITHLSDQVADDMATLSAVEDAPRDVPKHDVPKHDVPKHVCKNASTSDTAVSELVHLFKLLADDTRLWILRYLSRARELHVRALCERLGQSQPAVSHHLALLRVAGLIQLRREGKHNYYRLEPSRFDEMLRLFFSCFPVNGEEPTALNGRALSALVDAKRLSDRLGGIERAKQALKMLEKLM